MSKSNIKEIGYWKELKDDKGTRYKNSGYKPSEEEKAVHQLVYRDFQIGLDNINLTYPYYQNRNVVEEYNYNLHTLTMADDVVIDGEDWQTEWQTRFRRPLTRHKAIQIVSHVLSNPIYPHTSPINEKKKDARKKAEILNDLHKFARADNGYEHLYKSFLYEASISPVVIVKEGYVEKTRTIKTPNMEGGYDYNTVLDKDMTGFRSEIIPIDSFLIANPNEDTIQKQRFVITRRFIDIDQAEGIYGAHKNFEHVTPGEYMNHTTSGGFVLQSEKELQEQKLVEEITYYNREKDMYVVFLNGVLVTNWDNAINREDKNYPFAKLTYEPVKSGFFYGFPLASKMAQDQAVLDQVYNMTVDAMKLDLFPPVLINQNIEEDLYVPGATLFVNTDMLEVERLRAGTGVQQAFMGINQIEAQFAENSSGLRAGQVQPGERTGTEASILNANAQAILNVFVGNIITFAVDYGKLMKSTIKQHLLLKIVNNILSGEEIQMYKDISVKNKKQGGRTFNQEIRFVAPYIAGATPLSKRESEILKEERRSGNKVVEVNPMALLDYEYDMIIDAEQVAAESDQFRVNKYIQFYDRAINNPSFDSFAVSKNLAETMFPGRASEFLSKEEEMKQKLQALQAGGQIPQVGGDANFKEPKYA